MKRYRLKNKANNITKPVDKTAYKKQWNLVIKLNKVAKKYFLKIQITENTINKTKNVQKLYKLYFTKKDFHCEQKFTKSRVTSSETTSINIFNNYFVNFFFFFKLLFGCPTANFGPLSRGQPHSPDVNHCVLHFRPEGHREPRNEVGSLSPAERLVGFEPGTFWFLLQRLNPLGHSPQIFNSC